MLAMLWRLRVAVVLKAALKSSNLDLCLLLSLHIKLGDTLLLTAAFSTLSVCCVTAGYRTPGWSRGSVLV